MRIIRLAAFFVFEPVIIHGEACRRIIVISVKTGEQPIPAAKPAATYVPYCRHRSSSNNQNSSGDAQESACCAPTVAARLVLRAAVARVVGRARLAVRTGKIGWALACSKISVTLSVMLAWRVALVVGTAVRETYVTRRARAAHGRAVERRGTLALCHT